MSQVWFVTGSATGIGASVTRAALAAGHKVSASDINVEKLRSAFDESDANLLIHRLDIADGNQVQDAVAAVMTRFGRIDVLVNNAGFGQFGPFEEIDHGAIERQFSTNVFGTFNVTREVLPIMRAQRAGYIVNMSSNGGFKGVSGASMYSATKFAIEGFSESLAQEITGFGIKLTIVEPGAFRTDFLDTRSLKLSTGRVEDYANFRATAQAVFTARNGNQTGDPDKLAQALLILAAAASPPLRFVAGPDALTVVEEKMMSVAQELEHWRSLTLSTNF